MRQKRHDNLFRYIARKILSRRLRIQTTQIMSKMMLHNFMLSARNIIRRRHIIKTTQILTKTKLKLFTFDA